MWYFRAHVIQTAAISPEPAFSMHFSPEKKAGKATNTPRSLRQPPNSEIQSTEPGVAAAWQEPRELSDVHRSRGKAEVAVPDNTAPGVSPSTWTNSS